MPTDSERTHLDISSGYLWQTPELLIDIGLPCKFAAGLTEQLFAVTYQPDIAAATPPMGLMA